jgi:LCP family protein required for cell wall assembly
MPSKTSGRRSSRSSGYYDDGYADSGHGVATGSYGARDDRDAYVARDGYASRDAYGEQATPGDTRRSRSGGHNLAKPKKKKKKSKRSPIWSKITVTLGVLIMLVGFGGVAAAKSFMGDLASSIETGSVEESGAAPVTQSADKALKGAIDILMLGVDTRAGWAEQGKLSHADTIIILHIPASHDQAYMMSIPRDTAVSIPSWSPTGYSGAHDKINAAYTFGSRNGKGWTGGAGLMLKTVKGLTNIDFDGVVVIDFQGFQNVIKAMRGVYMCVEKDTWSSHYRKVDGKPVYTPGDPNDPPSNAWWHKKGCRDMAPWEALDYARQRHGLTKGDYDRQKHQQQLIKAMAKKATSAGIISNPVKLSQIIKAAGGSLKIDTHGVPLNNFIFTLKSLAGSDLIPLRTNGGTFATCAYNIGSSCEGLNQGTKDMFAAAKNDQLGQFITDNPQYLIPDKTGA